MQNDVLATGIMSFAMHELVYFGRSLPWMIVDRISYFNKYKIQNVRFSMRYPRSLREVHQLTSNSKEFLQPKSSGNVLNWFYSRISQSSFLRYGMLLHQAPANME